MKKTIMLAVLLIAMSIRAQTVTNFFADFNSSANGSATAINLNAGTAVGSWTVSALEESAVTNGIVNFEQGYYTNTATSDMVGFLRQSYLV